MIAKDLAAELMKNPNSVVLVKSTDSNDWTSSFEVENYRDGHRLYLTDENLLDDDGFSDNEEET